MMTRTLMLNAWYQPSRVVPWFKAVMLVFAGKADVLVEYDEEIRSPSTTIQTPAVIRLKNPVGMRKRSVKFSRLNVLARDNYTCQYCGQRLSARELNYDHVIPRVKGGKTVWENIVSACYPCNRRKAGRTPEEAGMRLLKRPIRPRVLPMFPSILTVTDIPEEWKGFVTDRETAAA